MKTRAALSSLAVRPPAIRALARGTTAHKCFLIDGDLVLWRSIRGCALEVFANRRRVICAQCFVCAGTVETSDGDAAPMMMSCRRYARRRHAYNMHAYDMRTHDIRAYDMRAYDMRAYDMHMKCTHTTCTHTTRTHTTRTHTTCTHTTCTHTICTHTTCMHMTCMHTTRTHTTCTHTTCTHTTRTHTTCTHTTCCIRHARIRHARIRFITQIEYCYQLAHVQRLKIFDILKRFTLQLFAVSMVSLCKFCIPGYPSYAADLTK